MLLPSVPLFLLLSLLPAVALLVLGRWGLAYAESRTTLAILSLALGAGLLFISLISAGSYSLQALQGGRESRWLLAIPLVPYVSVIVVMARARSVDLPRLALGASAGLVPLYFVGMYSALLAACSLGDCL
jgi:hypothetical protein